MQRSGRDAVITMANKDYHKAYRKNNFKTVKKWKQHVDKQRRKKVNDASEPIYSFKKVTSGVVANRRKDNYAPELYTKLSESSMKKYGIDKINSKNSTAKKRKGKPAPEKGVFYDYGRRYF